ncbi:MAG: 2-oxoglutarate dehydrogenase, E2 component, dihydrolipoamide succinyltransferase [Blastocatellia bacterium]|jgi:2-oxoglutarate dehydrogenase E2 component (dihydrolipoamide succinyltransferase)|nr:2-oxoglutarate dehydrogenase, E2 component, dihydrolipoamide succinyltransferase [Blastocatellia bacterium]
MSTDVIMPQMGESIAEGTIVKWLKAVGDKVIRDEPLFEISTDKVDAEIPSPASGTLLEIKVVEGQTVGINTVVAIIGEGGGAAAPAPAAAEAVPAPVAAPEPAPAVPASEVPGTAPAPPPPPAAPVEPPQPAAASGSVEELRRTRSSPLVRKLAEEHGVDISAVTGTGISGRVTKADILAYVESGGAKAAPAGSAHAPVAPSAPSAPAVPEVVRPTFKPGERVRVEPMSIMRRRIAENMVASRRTSAHVNTVFEMDCTKLVEVRNKLKGQYEADGAKLTYTPMIIKAVVDSLKAFPILNASIQGDDIVYKQDINVGIAVALDWGLIVPVIKRADEQSLLGLSRSVSDLAERARTKRLKPEEVQDGTFTITNPGIYGGLFGTPIINQPQVAILGIGAIEKRAVVINDAIAIRTMSFFALSFDHRLIDGAVADQFMAHLKIGLANFSA